MANTLVRPYDFILEPANLFDADPDRLRPFRVVAPPDPLSLFIVEDGALRLRPNEAARAPLNDPQGSFGELVLPRGVAVRGDTIFFADPARRRVLYWRPCTGAPRPLPAVAARPLSADSDAITEPEMPYCGLGEEHRPAERELFNPVGLAISARDDLVVVDAGYRRLLLFTQPGFVLRRIISLPARGDACNDNSLWRPVDAAAGPRGALYVADATGFIWRLDAQGRPDPLYGGVLPPGVVPRRIAVDGDGRAFVLAEEGGAVLAFDRHGRLMTSGEPPAPLIFTSIDDAVGNQPGAPRIRDLLGPVPLSLDGRELVLSHIHEQIRTGVAVTDGGLLALEGITDGPYAIYVPPRLTFAQTAALIIELDSRHFGNPWHRVVVERAEVERTGLRLFGRTSEQPLAALDATALTDPAWLASPVNTAEWLVQSPPGQYLYLGLEMIGPGDRTPELQRAYVYRERASSLSLLPATFQADEASRSVLDRLLSLFDTIYAELEVTIDEFAFLLDADSARPEFATSFLPWLASWFGLMLEQSWSEAQKRAFVREIMFLYRWRGTPKGIARLVELHTGVKSPQVIEHYPAWRELVLEDAAAGQMLTLTERQKRLRDWLNAPGIESYDLPGLKTAEPRHHFTILLPGYVLDDDDRLEALHRLLEAYIPAHTHYTLRRLPAHGFRLSYGRGDESDNHTPGLIVGVDIVLGSLPDWRVSPEVEPALRLGIGTLLPAAPAPSGVFQLGGPLRRSPRFRSVSSSCQDC